MGRTSSIVFVITVLYISYLLNLAIAAKPRGFSMKMIRSDSKESPLYLRYANLTQGERFRGLVDQSKARVRHLGSARAAAYNKSSMMNPDIVRPPVAYTPYTSFYMAMVGIGTFRGTHGEYSQNYYLIIDTSMDVVWTQCQGSIRYFYQDSGLYNRQSSYSYQVIHCDDDDFEEYCNDGHCNDEGLCTYSQEYLSGAESSGLLAWERFTINSNNGHFERLHWKMGCGIDQTRFGDVLGVPECEQYHGWNRPIPELGNAPIAGILGLGQGDDGLSFIFGLAYNGFDDRRFEYCLESYYHPGVEASHTYLRFGADAIIGGGPEVHTTPLTQDDNFRSPYHLNLLGISVDGVSAGFDANDFQVGGKTIIDSGTPFTTMGMPFFEGVRDLFLAYFNGFEIAPVHGPLNTCWRIPRRFNRFPEMIFHFQDANFVIREMSGIFVHFRDNNIICLGIVGVEQDHVNPYAVILGAMQQANKRILYDLDGDSLSFRNEQCTLGA